MKVNTTKWLINIGHSYSHVKGKVGIAVTDFLLHLYLAFLKVRQSGSINDRSF